MLQNVQRFLINALKIEVYIICFISIIRIQKCAVKKDVNCINITEWTISWWLSFIPHRTSCNLASATVTKIIFCIVFGSNSYNFGAKTGFTRIE